MDLPETVVLLCRGCCCGTPAKHARVDHDAQQDALEKATDRLTGTEVRVVDCLDECDRSNVAVIRKQGLPPKERDIWLGGLLTSTATDALADWIAGGGRRPAATRRRGTAVPAPAAAEGTQMTCGRGYGQTCT